ncbi:MAG: SUMF1/EgtB/PvdO family nonheme iron enzyme [Bacteroidales bacterium]|nr:SUMF1/EgtB/PvdO family nonheme iron enzyme [Bacteroidales bacterium]
MKKLFLLLSGVVLLWSCGSSDKGELVGVQNRPIFEDIDLKGMVFINQGNFSMGAGTQNVTYGTPPQPRTMQVSSYFMDETEITNNEYRQFVNWVIDSVARRMLGEAGIDGFLIEEDEYDEPLEPAILNKKEKIRWTEQETREALEDLYLPEKDRFYRRRTIDPAKLNYEYYWIDYAEAVKKESATAVKDEYKGTMFAPRPKGLNNRSSLIKREVVNVYPDTLCWCTTIHIV